MRVAADTARCAWSTYGFTTSSDLSEATTLHDELTETLVHLTFLILSGTVV